MAELSLLQQDALTAARLTDALQTAHRVTVCRSWSALERHLGRRGVDVCVVDADHPTREEALKRLTAIQQRRPAVALVAFGDFEGREQELYDLGRLGIDGVVPGGGRIDASEVRNTVDRALLAARARQAGELLEGRVFPTGIRAVTWSMEHARERPTAQDLAEAMGMTPSAFAARLRKEGFPSPSRLLVWGRLLLAGALLARDGRTVEEAAYKVGYAGASGLNRAMRREVGQTPGEVARDGGLQRVHRALFPPGGKAAHLRLLAFLLLWLGVSGCAGSPAPPRPRPAPPPTPVERASGLLDAPPLDQLQVGVLVKEAESGRTLLARNEGRRFIPASNQKLLTTAAALDRLGPDHRWRTALWSDAPLIDGALRGDLVLVGTGDPTLSDRWWPSAESAMEALADSLAGAGVARVEGRLVVDVSAWDSTAVAGSWEVGDLPYRYAAGAAAFAVAEGEVRAVVRGAPEAGHPGALVSWWPAGEPGYLRAELTTVPADSALRVRATHLPESGALVLRGRVPAGVVDTVRMAAREPVRLAAGLLERALRARGVAIAGPTVIRWTRPDPACALPDCPAARPLATLRSPPLSEVARAILEPSQNWITEQLLRTLGEAATGEGSRSAGVEVLERWLVDEVGLDTLEAVPEDGSGMAARNLVTPRALVAVLDHARRAPWAEAWRAALAAPGEEDSTLERRLPELEGRLAAKTGTISNVNALSGYLVRDDGTELIFSVLTNGSGLPASTVRDAMDAVVRTLAER